MTINYASCYHGFSNAVLYLRACYCKFWWVALRTCCARVSPTNPSQALSSELSASGAKLVAVKCDLTKEGEILNMFEHTQSQLGAISVLVNNAGLAHNAPLLTGETRDWREMMEVSSSEACLQCSI